MSRTDPQFNVRLEPELKAWLDAKAKATRLTRTWLINHLIRKEIEREQQNTAQ